MPPEPDAAPDADAPHDDAPHDDVPDDSLSRRVFIAGALAATAAACSSGGHPSTDAVTSSAATGSRATPSTAGSTAPTTTGFLSSGPRDRPQVALTFHVSGDRDLAVRLLDLLRAEDAPITAFMVGSWLEANGDLAKRFVDDGHELANHTYTHLTFPSLDRATMRTEVERCRDRLVQVVGTPGRFFRPSGTSNGTDDPGATVRDVARAAGYATIAGFDVDPSDYADPGSRLVVQRTAAAVQRGSIVSLHFGHAGTIDALPQILAALVQRGLQPVTLTTLLS